LRMAVRGFSRPRPDQSIRGKRGAKSPSSEERLARSSVSETTERRTGARHPPRERGCCREEKRSRSSLWEPFRSSRRINARRKRVPVLQLQPIGSEAMRSCRGDMAETDRCASAMLAETAPRSRSPVGDCFWRATTLELLERSEPKSETCGPETSVSASAVLDRNSRAFGVAAI